MVAGYGSQVVNNCGVNHKEPVGSYMLLVSEYFSIRWTLSIEFKTRHLRTPTIVGFTQHVY